MAGAERVDGGGESRASRYSPLTEADYDDLERHLCIEKGPGGVHRLRDAEKLLFHRVVAMRLGEDPDGVIEVARRNLTRWLSRNPETDSYREWEVLLADRTSAELVALITAEDDEGQRLRQSTPFVGIITQEERQRLLTIARRVWDAVPEPSGATAPLLGEDGLEST